MCCLEAERSSFEDDAVADRLPSLELDGWRAEGETCDEPGGWLMPGFRPDLGGRSLAPFSRSSFRRDGPSDAPCSLPSPPRPSLPPGS